MLAVKFRLEAFLSCPDPSKERTACDGRAKQPVFENSGSGRCDMKRAGWGWKPGVATRQQQLVLTLDDKRLNEPNGTERDSRRPATSAVQGVL